MKQKTSFGASLLLFCVINIAHAVGREGGNGGDICEDRFKIVRDDINSWLIGGGAAGLQLPTGITLDGYKTGMLLQISTAQVSCTDDVITIGDAEKTCENFVDPTGVDRIVCNTDRFMKTDQSDQYVLVHHEYAGLAGIEVNVGEDSNYVVSNQLSGYLTDQVEKKLAIAPAKATNCESVVQNPDGTWTITEPWYEDSGQDFKLSSFSSYMGVCAYFGFPYYVPDSVSIIPASDPTLVVNDYGKFGGYDTASANQVIARIESLRCSNSDTHYNPLTITVSSDHYTDTLTLNYIYGKDQHGEMRWGAIGGIPEDASRNDFHTSICESQGYPGATRAAELNLEQGESRYASDDGDGMAGASASSAQLSRKIIVDQLGKMVQVLPWTSDFSFPEWRIIYCLKK